MVTTLQIGHFEGLLGSCSRNLGYKTFISSELTCSKWMGMSQFLT